MPGRGAGTAEKDYAGRDVRGQIVLTSAQPEAVVPLAVERFGAAGIVSYVQNQKTAWWGENGDKTDLAKVNGIAPMLGYTMIIMLDLNKVMELDDGWTVATLDHRLSAHFEHTIAITDGAPEILTA